MRCKHCSTTWKLSGSDDSPIGKCAPGHYLIVVAILGMLAMVLALWLKSLGAVAIGLLTLAIFVMAIVGCGFKAKAGTYQGSECPECEQKTRILPWDF